MITGTIPSEGLTNRLMGRRALIVWLIAVIDVASLIVVAVVIPRDPQPLVFAALIAMIASFGAVGALVAVRRPRNPIGWILWASATLVAFSTAGSDYSGYSVDHLDGSLPGTVLVAWLSSWLFIPAIGLTIIFVPLLFPDGRLPSRRWRPVAWFSAAAIAAGVLLGVAFRLGPLQNLTAVENPFGIWRADSPVASLGFPPGLGMLLAMLLALASTVARYRQSSQVQRQQLKWFGSAGLLTAIVFGGVPDEAGFLSLAGLALLPLAIGIAVLRYRLYEIDRIVSRTIAYAAITGLLVATYAGLILLLQDPLRQITGGDTIAIAVSTLVVAALFQPIRHRIQRFVDRRFDRARYDGERMAAAFSERLRDEVDIETVTTHLREAVASSVKPARIGLWLRQGIGR